MLQKARRSTATTALTLLIGVPTFVPTFVPTAVPTAVPTSGFSVDWRAEVAASILARLSGSSPSPEARLSAAELADLQTLYGPGQGRALWIEASGRPTGDARAARALLAGAADDGLDPADYEQAALTALAAAMDAGPAPDRERLAAFDVLLSAGTVRYLRHLHRGRVDPRPLGVRFDAEPERHDAVAVLREALATHRVPQAAAGLTPPLPQYQALRGQLARYRALADQDGIGWAPGAQAIRPGDPLDVADALRQRLMDVGDLPPATPPASGVYDDTLAAGVRRFQARHGLTADGVLGPATRKTLAVPMRSRLRQMELALERLRWLPDIGDERLVALNIPMFRLATWEGGGATGPAQRMRAIVGRALITETPVFTAMMRSVVFRPYWNVPRSILRQELLPALERDPAGLGRSDFEIVDGRSDDAPVVAPTAAAVAGLRAGTLRLRQRPGPANALGLVKFEFPNDADVYLHGTPTQELFERTRRDFSHGCVRVEDPAALAAWVLRDEPGWDRSRVDAAMSAAVSTRVSLAAPIRVVLFYTTAAVSEDGTVHFADDIYGHDGALAGALVRARRRS